MRLLHTSDWHLGATLGRLSREPDHIAVLDEIVDIANEQRPHLILHTGDLFDTARPPVEAMRLGLDALRRLGEIAPVVVLAGNHDSRPLFRLFGQIVDFTTKTPRIRFVADVVRPDHGGILEFAADKGEVVRLASMPFLHPNALVDVFDTPPEGWTGKYADSIRVLQDMYRRAFEHDHDNSRHINLFAAHLHVGGAVLAKSERAVHVSQDYAVDVEALPPVTYAAFGHIHKPQALAGVVPGRYAGSPIQLDYGEEGETKTVVVVEAHPGASARVNVVELTRGRPLVKLSGTLNELANAASKHQGQMILTVTVNTDEPQTGLVEQVTGLYPNADLHLLHNKVSERGHQAVRVDHETEGDLDFRGLFRDFLDGRSGLGEKQSERLTSIFERLLGSVEAEQDPELEEEKTVLAGAVD